MSRKRILCVGGRVTLAAFLALQTNAAIAAPDEIAVESFEGPAPTLDAQNVNASITTSRHATHGSHALRMVFDDTDEDRIFVRFLKPVDATPLGEVNLAFDLTNSSEVSVYFTATVHSGDALEEAGRNVIAPGETRTFYTVLSGFASSAATGLASFPPAWPSSDVKLTSNKQKARSAADTGMITGLSFATSANPSVRTLEVDNIRVRANPAADPYFLTDLVDRYGQADRLEFPLKVHSDEELKAAADQEKAALATSAGAPDRSKWGGWTAGPRLKATGYFRTEKVDGKWWMVDPDGYLFWSNALANVRMANTGTQTGYDFMDPAVRHIDPEELTPEDSLGIDPIDRQYRHTRYLATPIRRSLFKWLPRYDEPLGAHYGYRRTFHHGIQDSGEIFSFYQANLHRRYGDSFLQEWRDVTIDRMREWGMTSLGNWVDPMFYQSDRIPYFANGWITGDFNTLPTPEDEWAAMPDVYDPEFRRRARLTVEQVAREVQGSPWCVGVFIDNEKSWGRGTEAATVYGLVLSALSQDASDSAAKAHFTAMLRRKYNRIDDLNAAWGTQFASWSNFEAQALLPDPERARADLSEMLADYATRYFATVSGELEKVMPDHMYMGVRMTPWGMPEEAVRASLTYSDVISFNNYREIMHPDFWSFLSQMDKPALIGEFHIGTTSDSGFYHPGLIHAADQTDRARLYEQYMQSVLDMPVMVGAHWFQYIDEPVTGRAYDGENYNIGFVTNTDIPYPEMVEAAKRVNYEIYSRRFGQ